MVLERILLQTIKFDLQVEHPYQFLLKYAKQLKGKETRGFRSVVVELLVFYSAGDGTRTFAFVRQVLYLGTISPIVFLRTFHSEIKSF